MMSITTAMRLAEEDMDHIRIQADLLTSHGVDDAVVVDGTNYSPSWRALNGGARIWEEADHDSHDAYLHVLDMATDSYGDGTDWYLSWDDGCLWLKRADDNA